MRLHLALLSLVILSGCQSTPAAEKTILVYESANYKQCEANASTLAASQAKLKSANIEVVSSQCGELLDRVFPMVCGGATADINIVEIPSSAQAQATKLGFTTLPPAESTTSATPYQIKACAGDK